MLRPAGGRSPKIKSQQRKSKEEQQAVAIYSASVSTIGRSAGRSATAAAAYRTGTLVIDERQGLIHDYTRKSGVDHVSRHYPEGVADIGTDELWNRAELAESKKNANVARELLIALPHELQPFQRRALAEAISGKLVERFHVAVESSVHLPDKEGDQRNHHAHILFTTRVMDSEGKLGDKTRALDERYGRGPKEIEWIREMVEIETNLALERAGLDVRVDRRTLEEQQAAALAAGDLEAAKELDRAPQTHEGPRVTQIRRECEKAGREPLGALDIAAANDAIGFDLDAGRVELAEVISMIEHLEKRNAERDTAHAEAIHENTLRDSLKVALTDFDSVRSERIDLAIKLDQGKPRCVLDALDLKKEMVRANKEADAWRKAHPIAARLADSTGVKLETDRTAEHASAAYLKSPALKEARAWTAENKIDKARYVELTETLESSKVEIRALKKELSTLNTADPEVTRAIKDEVAQAVEHAQPEIAAFVDNHRTEIAAAADMGGVEAWMSSEIIETGNPVIDQMSRKAAQFRSRMMREELQRAEQNDAIAGQAIQKFQASLRKALDGSLRSAAREAEPQIDYAAEARRITAEAAERALRAPKQAPAEYVPTWKRGKQHDGFEPGR
ncbi:MobA/MobL family protein [Pseudomonas sp.]|uniref:MobA/MobL family protein n=1 Tax=Pseudomonas sp. TaxID=306 RepID=UPI00289847EC|nr:MobA/MobL family protein [Pseudomonas sp.]